MSAVLSCKKKKHLKIIELILNYMEGGGGHVKFYPYKKGGRKVLAILKGGAQKVLG